MILGEVDVGKSTFCAFLANILHEHKVRTSIIDGDVGQADIGPPTTISSSTVHKPIFSLQELAPERSHFIGDTTPSSVPSKLTRSIVSLRNRLQINQFTILNTDGWLREDAAVEHKLDLLDSVRPSLVLGLSLVDELDPILERTRFRNIRLEPSKYARTRTRQERKRAREEGYKRFFQGARDLDLKLSQIRLKMFDTPRQQRIDQASSHKGTLSGILDEEGDLAAIGRIVRIWDGMLRITTNARETPRIIELGAVVLSPRYVEIGFES